MRKKRIALCDANEKYIFLLEEYFRGIDYLPFVADVYTDYAKYLACDEKYHYEGALIAEELLEGAKEPVGKKYLVLTQERSAEEGRTYRYQSAEGLLQALLHAFFSQEQLQEAESMQGRRCRYIGFYSPIKRCLQTSFALVLGQLLAKRGRVLYLNLETYSGWEETLVPSAGAKEDLADLLYYFKNIPKEFDACFQNTRTKINEMDYIRPSLSFLDLQQMEEGEWEAFLAEISKCGPYDYILLDLSDSLPGLLSILKKCDRIYAMQSSESCSRNKRKQYEVLLKEMHQEEVLEKTRWCVLPQFGQLPENPSQLSFSGLADYVRNLMREETEGILGGR